MDKSAFKALGGTYVRNGDYLFPNITIEDSATHGKWGLLRKQYLKEHCHGLYSSILLTGKLDRHLAEIGHSCEERADRIVQQLKRAEGITEALKARDQMEWVRRMNSIQRRAEEIVLAELIHC